MRSYLPFDDLFVVNCLCTCIVYMYQLIGVGNCNWLQLIFNMIMVMPQGVIPGIFPDSTKFKCFTHSHIAYEAIYTADRPDTLMHLVFMGVSATSTFHCLSAWLVYYILGVMNSYIGIFMFMLFIVYVMMDRPYAVWVRQPTIGLKYIALSRNPDLPPNPNLPPRRKGECSSHYGLAVAAKAKSLCFSKLGSVVSKR